MCLEEIFMSPLVTPTSCYCMGSNTRVRKGSSENSEAHGHTINFATENHIVGISVGSDETVRTKTHAMVPRANTSVICVGYSQVRVDHAPERGVQALVLVDRAVLDENYDLEANPQVARPAFHQSANSTKDDTASVTSNSVQDGSVASLAASRLGGSRRPSLSNGSSSLMLHHGGSSNLNGSVSAMTNTTALSSTSSNHTRKKSDGSGTILAAGATHGQLSEHPNALISKAHLILQIPSVAEPSRMEEYIAILEFRPLSPCIIPWSHGKPKTHQRGAPGFDGVPSDDKSTAAVPPWAVLVGSADDSTLRLFVPDTASRRLIRSSDILPRQHFTMDTPILSLVHYETEMRHTLGLACQDGTIQLVTWDSLESYGRGDNEGVAEPWDEAMETAENSSNAFFRNIASRQVIVDGPLLGLQLQAQSTEESLRLIVGSLCGYVCELVQQPTENKENETRPATLRLQEPTMIVGGLWNSQLDMEDPVLAVHAHGEYVAVGTLLGRCLLYTKNAYSEDSPLYQLLWECRLPYSVHGFEILERNNGDKQTWFLVVVTRRSAHVFQAHRETATNPQSKPRLSANLAKKRFHELLEGMSPDKEEVKEPEEPTMVESAQVPAEASPEVEKEESSKEEEEEEVSI